MKILLDRACCRDWHDRRKTPGNWLHVAGRINNITASFPDPIKDERGHVLHLQMPLPSKKVIEEIRKIQGVFHIEFDASEAQQLGRVVS